MILRTLPFSLTGFGLALLAFAPSAEAHIRLIEPQARYEITGFETGIKACPCGLGESPRAGCDLSVDASDPDRSERVSRFEAGSTITLRFEEYVDHTGSFRVAFDPDGAEVADFNSNILVPIVADPSGGAGNTGEGSIWEIEVQLPNMTCDNCTLQLIQAMHGDTQNPVADPTNLSTYYTCVDLELVAPGTLGETDSDPGAEDPAPGSMEEPMGAGDGSMAGNADMGSNLGAVPQMAGDDTSGGGMMPAGGNTTSDNDNMAVGSLTPAPAGMQSPAGAMPGSMMGGESSGGSSSGCSLGSRSPGGLAALLALGSFLTLAAGRRARRRATVARAGREAR